jgi:hypothetical protein
MGLIRFGGHLPNGGSELEAKVIQLYFTKRAGRGVQPCGLVSHLGTRRSIIKRHSKRRRSRRNRVRHRHADERHLPGEPPTGIRSDTGQLSGGLIVVTPQRDDAAVICFPECFVPGYQWPARRHRRPIPLSSSARGTNEWGTQIAHYAAFLGRCRALPRSASRLHFPDPTAAKYRNTKQ